VTSNSGSLYGIAAELLAKSAAILAGTAAGAPSNQYVSHGEPPYDCCDTLTVHVGMLRFGSFKLGADGSTGVRDPKMPVVPVVPLVVTALRCQRAQAQGGLQITLPSPSLMAADAATIMADGWSLFCGINNAQRAGSLFAGYPCRPFEVDPALPVAPEGGCLGWTLSVQVALDGFDPAGQ
jgi:hypothetical protein